MNPPGRARARGSAASLPFALTGAQERVWARSARTWPRRYPMNRLLQGDVGSGKTVVAALAVLTAIEAGYQAALMAPTEILAEQHLMTLEPAARAARRARWRCSPPRSRARERAAPARRRGGRRGRLRGGHARARAGARGASSGWAWPWWTSSTASACAQRATLEAKGEQPDVLVMTATPIPRTLALTALRRPRRLACSTSCRPAASRSSRWPAPRAGAPQIYDFLREQVAAGRQVYVVYPLVEESELIDLQGRHRDGASSCRRRSSPICASACCTGGMAFDDKDAVMRRVQGRRDPHPGVDHRDRGRHRRAQRLGDADRARRALRPLAAPPAPRPGRPRPVEELLHPARRRPRREDARAPARGDDRDQRRLQDRGGRTSSCAGPATSSARASRGCRSSASPTCCATRPSLEEARRDALALIARGSRAARAAEHRGAARRAARALARQARPGRRRLSARVLAGALKGAAPRPRRAAAPRARPRTRCASPASTP